MIVVRLNGGLGNQMFQYAAAYALSVRLGVECRADLSSFQRSIRRYELDCFIGAPEIAGDRDLPLSSRLIRHGIPEIISSKLGSIFDNTHIFHQDPLLPFVFEPTFPVLPDNTYLDGYFQSEKYFKNIAAAIRRLFAFRHPPHPANKHMLDEIAGLPTVSVHVRRGDYVSNPHTNQFHGVCSLEYYQAAFRMIAGRVKDARFAVFSDDPAWARKNLKPPAETLYVDENNSERGYEDMRLMSACRHHIIANSSFSWWAAWLNPLPDKIVIAPKRWLADTTVPLDDLLPELWLAI